MIRSPAPILVVALVVLAAPADAQQWQVARENFGFAGRALTVQIDVDGEGSLHVIRGSSGIVRVTGRVDGGMTAAGLTSRGQLTLTGAGDGPVEYVIAVPERVWIDIRFPDRPGAESMGTQERSRTFSWGAAAPPAPSTATVRAPDTDRGLGGPASFTVFAAALAPATVGLPDLRHVRSVEVRVEGSTFRVGASRPLTLSRGDPDVMEIRPVGPPIDLVLMVPADTDYFTLSAGGDTALVVRAGQVSVLCSPSTRQWLSGGRGWVTFTPRDGALRCEPLDRAPARTLTAG
jgi:hypothetical protein